MTGVRSLLGRPGGVLAVVRLAAVPVFLAAERLVNHPLANTGPFVELLVVAAVYAAVALGGELRGRPVAPPGVLAAVDLLVIAALVATSGGPFSELRYAFFVLPVGAALLLRPALTAVASGVCAIAYALIALTFPNADAVRSDAVGFELTQVLFLLWMGAAATLLSAVLERRAREISELAASRGRLVAQALDAEDRARRRLAEALHDEALQNLLAARQFLDTGDPDAADLAREGLDESVTQIRRAVFDLHPYLLEQSGLRAALQAVAERAARRAGFAVHVDAPASVEGLHDVLLFSIGRELIANAAKHSAAEHLVVQARRAAGDVELVVTDDGRGLEPGRALAARADGHVGLASCAERADAVGGRLTFGSGPGGKGTVVRVRLPVRDAAGVPA